MIRSSDPRATLAASLRQLAAALTATDDRGTPTWHPEGRYQRDALITIRAGVAMLTNGEEADRLARSWAATGLVTTAVEPGIREGCNCEVPLLDADGSCPHGFRAGRGCQDCPQSECPHGTATERGALNTKDQWQARVARLRQQQALLADNGHDYETLVDLITRVGERLGRVQSVESCAGCREPITGIGEDKAKSLDGEPYHRGSCWWQAYNATRGRRGA